ncbi:thymidine kinase, cytosolic isoform X2 [Hydra vulgaris]|uniref:thymidine kinase, cytosolic isoform X2 n=1 Tax=Hydra vulgaris TaxID=6087 RepID=UPI001F5EAA8A|nr:thymidine kinase, cytosolic isoform X2 [Hydra vulgaris]
MKSLSHLIFGPMFSGKTTELLRRITRYSFARYKCLLIKYEKDIRYSNNGVSTHDQRVHEAVACTVLRDVKHLTKEFDVIGVDEGQFYPDVVQFCEEMAGMKKTVIVAALDGDFQRKPFGNVIDLVPLAESVIKLSAVCMCCYGEASFTKRLGSDTKVEIIGGADKYMAACRGCHKKQIDVVDYINLSKEENRQPLASIDNRQLTRGIFRTKESVAINSTM